MIRILLSCLALGSVHADDYDLFVLAGQSNAQGWTGDARHYPTKDGDLDADIPLYYDYPKLSSSQGDWVSLGPQNGRFSRGHFGPEITFARTLKSQGYSPAIFKFAMSSSSLDHTWKRPGQDGLYDRMTRSLEQAIRKLRKAGHRPRLRALIWIQGETDAVDPGAAARYEENLAALIRHFRTQVASNRSLPVILGVDEENPFVERRPIIVAAQKNLARKERWTTRSSMAGLAKADQTHLKPSALQKHGIRIADAFLELSSSR